MKCVRAYVFDFEAAASAPSSASAKTLLRSISFEKVVGSEYHFVGLFLGPVRSAERKLVWMRCILTEGGHFEKSLYMVLMGDFFKLLDFLHNICVFVLNFYFS